MTTPQPQLRRRNLTLLISLAVLMQSLYADGFMPASFASGWPVMLCPDGMPAGFMMSGHAGHHQHGDASGESQVSDSCPLGKALSSQAIMPSPGVAIAPPSATVQVINSPNQAVFRTRRDTFFQSRAPPFFVVV